MLRNLGAKCFRSCAPLLQGYITSYNETGKRERRAGLSLAVEAVTSVNEKRLVQENVFDLATIAMSM
jgi:hypothetical protein